MRMEMTLDCNDLETLAAFWAAALDYSRGPAEHEGYVALEPRSGNGVPLTLQRVPEQKLAKNRLHLDLLVDDVEAEVSRLQRLGARPVDEHTGYGMRWSILCDPEGNEFCVASPSA